MEERVERTLVFRMRLKTQHHNLSIHFTNFIRACGLSTNLTGVVVLKVSLAAHLIYSDNFYNITTP